MAELHFVSNMFPIIPESQDLDYSRFREAKLFLDEAGEVDVSRWKSVINIIISKLKPGLPFLVDQDMQLMAVPNAFLSYKANESGDSPEPTTWEAVGRALYDFISWCEVSGLDWQEIKQKHITAYRDSRDGSAPNRVSSHTGRPLERSTINLRLGYVVEFYTWAAQRGYIDPINFDRKVLQGYRRGKKQEKGMLAHLDNSGGETEASAFKKKASAKPLDFLFLEDAQAFISALPIRRDRLFALVMLEVGLRLEECRNLTIDDVPIPAPGEKRKHLVGTVVGKGSKERKVRWPVPLCHQIQDWIDEEREHIAAAVEEATGKYPKALWLTVSGTTIAKSTISGKFSAASKQAGIHCHPHMLRHTFGTYHYLKFKDLERLALLMGHSSIDTTRRYVHMGAFLDDVEVFEQHQLDIDAIIASAMA